MAFKLPTRTSYSGSGFNPVPLDTPGFLGDIVRSIENQKIKTPTPTPWRPPADVDYIAQHMDHVQRKIFLQKVSEWRETHPTISVPPVPTEICKLNYEPILKLHKKFKDHRPSPEATVEAMKEAGYSDYKIERYKSWWCKMEDTDAERQEVIDTIFAKYPSAHKPDPKKKQVKVIKAVKKKINNEQT